MGHLRFPGRRHNTHRPHGLTGNHSSVACHRASALPDDPTNLNPLSTDTYSVDPGSPVSGLRSMTGADCCPRWR
jgi:hypothetical protein